MKKRGLAVIYDPHNLYEFIWYYCNKGKSKKWDALCLPNAQKGEYMHTYCEKSEVFETVIRKNTGYEGSSSKEKINMFLSMFGYFVTGRRKSYCKKLINQFVNIDEYDEIVIIADVGIVSGACCALGKSEVHSGNFILEIANTPEKMMIGEKQKNGQYR